MKKLFNHVFSKNGWAWLLYYFIRVLHIDKFVPDKPFLILQYICTFGHKPNIDAPKLYNEKLLWLKLYDRKDIYTTLVDKYEVKNYVSTCIGEEYVIPLLGVWNNVDEIDFNRLPEKFVLKTTASGGSTGVVVCKSKSTLDIDKVKKQLKRNLRKNYYLASREWPYKNAPRRIIAEEYKEDEYGELRDYKFFCFRGEVKALFIASERATGNVKFNFYDADFNPLDIVQCHPKSSLKLERPKNFEKMKSIASKLSQSLPQARVDLFDVDGNIYFGEITLFHHGGMVPFSPNKWNQIFGDWIEL